MSSGVQGAGSPETEAEAAPGTTSPRSDTGRGIDPEERDGDLRSPSRRQWLTALTGAAVGSVVVVGSVDRADAAPAGVVDTTSDQTIGGVKTFLAAPVVPASAFPQGAVQGLVTTLAGKQDTIKPGTFVAPGDPVAPSVPGANSGTRYVGGTASGAPTTGTFAVGDFVIDRTGGVWVCIVAGTPGNWVQAGVGKVVEPLTLQKTLFVSSGSGGSTGGQAVPGIAFADDPSIGIRRMPNGPGYKGIEVILDGDVALQIFADNDRNAVAVVGFGTNRTIWQSTAGHNFFSQSGHHEWESADGDVLTHTGYVLGTSTGKSIRYTTDATEKPACPLQAQAAPGVNAQEWLGSDAHMMGAFNEDDCFELFQPGKGVRMRSPNGTRWRVTVNDTGQLAVSKDDAAPPPAPLPPTAASDDFNRSDRPLAGDNGWNVRVGGFSIVSNAAAVTNHVGFDLAVRECSLADCRLGVHVTGAAAGLAFRWTDNNNYWFATGSSVSRFKDGILTDVLGYFRGTQPGDFLEIELNGSSIKMFMNGVQLGSTITDTFNASSTQHGLSATALGSGWDDFIVAALA